MTPSSRQVDATRAVVEWYRATHHGSPDDVGLIGTFCSRAKIGEFASSREALERGDDEALFKLLVSVAMFQRLRDALVMNILRGISTRDAAELTSARALLRLARESECEHARSNEALLRRCDLGKNEDGAGCCSVRPEISCHLKRHTVLLRRYGHFGKMPSSAALSVSRDGVGLNRVREAVLATCSEPTARAQLLVARLSEIWRISDKLSSMFLSLVSAPEMGLRSPPWQAGIDWTWFVVVDRNVDLFLESLGYKGEGTYDARRNFVRELSAAIDLRAIEPTWPGFHPRLVQQAMYLFMSASNRRAAAADCMHRVSCRSCPAILARRCPVRALVEPPAGRSRRTLSATRGPS